MGIGMKKLAGVVAAGTAVVAVLVTPGLPAGATQGGSKLVGEGPDYVYGDNAFSGAYATVASSTQQGDELFVLRVKGIDASSGSVFGAHVHQRPCGPASGDSGVHYTHNDPTGTMSLEEKEVWLDLTVDDEGHGKAVSRRPWQVTDRANRSVVIHIRATAPDGVAGSRLACIDLDA